MRGNVPGRMACMNGNAFTNAHTGRKTPNLLNVELVSSGWINKYLLSYELPDGRVIEYESVSRKGPEQYAAALERNGEADRCGAPGGEGDGCRAAVFGEGAGNAALGGPEGDGFEGADAICIVPVLPDGSLLLIREFRYPVNGWVVAFPAGLVEPGESVRDCIDRELAEETGYRVRDGFDGDPVELLPQSGYSSVGMGEESVRVAIARVEPAGEACLQPGELIEPFVLECGEVGAFLDSNEDMIGTRCQLVLEIVRRTGAL